MEVVGTISGTLPRPSTVTDGEVRAIVAVLEALSEEDPKQDVTTDSRVALKQHKCPYVCKSTSHQWSEVWQKKHLVNAVWIKVHMTEQAFVDRFGEDWRWRWHVNAMADELAGIRAKEAFCQASYQAMLSVDRLASTLAEFLAE